MTVLDRMPDSNWFFCFPLSWGVFCIAVLGIIHPLCWITVMDAYHSELFMFMYALIGFWSLLSCGLLYAIIMEASCVYVFWIWFTLAFAAAMACMMIVLFLGFCVLGRKRKSILAAIGFVYYLITLYFVVVVNMQRKEVFGFQDRDCGGCPSNMTTVTTAKLTPNTASTDTTASTASTKKTTASIGTKGTIGTNLTVGTNETKQTNGTIGTNETTQTNGTIGTNLTVGTNETKHANQTIGPMGTNLTVGMNKTKQTNGTIGTNLTVETNETKKMNETKKTDDTKKTNETKGKGSRKGLRTADMAADEFDGTTRTWVLYPFRRIMMGPGEPESQSTEANRADRLEELLLNSDECRTPHKPAHGRYTVRRRRNSLRLKLRCNKGYSENTVTTKCKYNWWDRPLPQCRKRRQSDPLPLPGDGCLMPDYPENGAYMVAEHEGATPGDHVIGDSVILMVTCNEPYRAVDPFVVCVGGRWRHAPPSCQMHCKLVFDPTVEYKCLKDFQDKFLACDSWQPDGATVAATCRPGHAHRGPFRYMRCRGEEWDHVVSCVPNVNFTK